MTRLIMWNLVTLEGFFEGPKKWDLDWHEYVWGDELEQFSRTVRKSLMTNDFGFLETYVFCGLCGRRELVGSLKCSVCGNVLKRCIDCGHYDPIYQQCALHGFYVYASEAEHP